MENGQEKKGLGPLAWIGIGCGVITLIILVVVLIGGFLVANKVKDVAGDFKANPELAAARTIVKLNPEIEEVGFDEEKGTITVREKETGKTVTANFKDIKEGKFSLSNEEGEEVTFDADESGEGGSMKITTEDGSFEMNSDTENIPDWVPIPDGVTPMGHHSMKGKEGIGGGFTAEVKMDMDKVAEFYKKSLEDAGYMVNVQSSSGEYGESRAVNGTDSSTGRYINARIMVDEGKQVMIVSYSESILE